MLNSIEAPPEKTGHAFRTIVLNYKKDSIEIRKDRYIENTISLKNLKGIILSNNARALIKYLTTSEKPSQFSVPESDKLLTCKFIPVQIMLEKGSLDLIMPNIETYIEFAEAYEEIIRSKKNVKPILKYLQKAGRI